MNARELKDYLYDIARRKGNQTLTQDEIDFMNGKISFQTYQNRCYVQYCQGKLSKKKAGSAKS